MFVLLAAVFAFGFVIFGVGSGSTGISEVFNGQIPFFDSGGGAGGPDADDARGRIKDNPKDAKAYRDLATALENDQRREEAIDPLEHYTRLRPKDTNALSELAGLYLSKARRLETEAAIAQAESQSLFQSSLFLPAAQSRLGKQLTADPITQAATTEASTRLTQLYGDTRTAYGSAQSVYARLAAAQPRDPQLQLQLANTAQLAGDTQAAIRAYERFIKIAPEDPLVPSVRAQLKRLRQAQSVGSPPGGG